jgi:hypothetical protein
MIGWRAGIHADGEHRSVDATHVNAPNPERELLEFGQFFGKSSGRERQRRSAV